MKTLSALNTLWRVEGNYNAIYVTSIENIVEVLLVIKELHVTHHQVVSHQYQWLLLLSSHDDMENDDEILGNILNINMRKSKSHIWTKSLGKIQKSYRSSKVILEVQES